MDSTQRFDTRCCSAGQKVNEMQMECLNLDSALRDVFSSLDFNSRFRFFGVFERDDDASRLNAEKPS